MKQFNLSALADSRYRKQFCVNPTITQLNDKKYVYFLTQIISGGAWTAQVKGFHPDGNFSSYTITGNGNTLFEFGNEIIASEVTFTGVSLVRGFTLENINMGKA
jgi:hypothetical protein